MSSSGSDGRAAWDPRRITDALGEIRKDVAALLAMASTSVLGYTLLDNPIGFVLAVIYQISVDVVMGVFAQVGHGFWLLWDQFTTVLIMAGDATITPFATIGSWILDIVIQVDTALSTTAASLGPAGPFLIIVFWVTVVYVLVRAVQIARSQLRGVVQWI